MKKLVVLIVLLTTTLHAYKLPDKKLIPYQYMDIQEFFVKHHCFLADYKINGVLPSEIIRRECYKNNINPKWVLTRMQVERETITGHVDGKYFITSHHKKPLKIVLRECCGYGLCWEYKGHKLNPRRYTSFKNQIKYCAEFMGNNLRKHTIYATLFLYDPTEDKYDGVELFCQAWYYLFKEDKR